MAPFNESRQYIIGRPVHDPFASKVSIKTRPVAELAVLPRLADDRVFVYGGGQGPGYSLAEVIYMEILGTNVPAGGEQGKSDNR
jgi:hypothetical protein